MGGPLGAENMTIDDTQSHRHIPSYLCCMSVFQRNACGGSQILYGSVKND